ncbi:T6SS phospholipase effector Tle1-like catalytic domain-containing protein, partial [Xenorhabdus szentirmaii]
IQGRLPLEPRQVESNIKKQKKEEAQYLLEVNQATGRRNGFVCSQSLHISLFFDGTNNNEEYDTNGAKPPHPSNIAKLYHASLRDAKEQGYFSYYMPGVGTPFPKIGELDYSTSGLAFASGGENRINWALLMLVDALTLTLTKDKLDDSISEKKIKEMCAAWPLTGEVNRRQAIKSLLAPLQEKIKTAKPKLLAIKLFIYGFSRGAAEARTFVNWLAELFETPEGAERPEQSLLGLPVSIEFLGLLDTVASVGVAHLVPFADGHMGWADGTQQLPDESRYPNLVKSCYHMVAAYEQRSSFPLDTLRRPSGEYPSNTLEILYPGMHSDVGGGYPPGDQGKAIGDQGLLLSQITLHDLYSAAFDAGAPLTIPQPVIPDSVKASQPSRVMPRRAIDEFYISSILVERFNAWRTTIITESKSPFPAKSTPNNRYEPILIGKPLETLVEEQMGWITAWRIGRFAYGSYQSQPFFKQATEWDKERIKIEKKNSETKTSDIKQDRKSKSPNAPGRPIFEPTIDKTQIGQGAKEFRDDFYNQMRSHTSITQLVLDTIPKHVIYLINSDDESAEYEHMKAEGLKLYSKLFSDNAGTVTNDPTMAQVCALFDNQVHDSRAWFMHDNLGSRELWSGYFRYRMIFSDSDSNKELSPIAVAGQLVGIATLVGGVVYIAKQKDIGSMAAGLAGTIGIMSMEYQVIDQISGVALPFVAGAEDLLKPTTSPGDVINAQKQQAIEKHFSDAKKNLSKLLNIAEDKVAEKSAPSLME